MDVAVHVGKLAITIISLALTLSFTRTQRARFPMLRALDGKQLCLSSLLLCAILATFMAELIASSRRNRAETHVASGIDELRFGQAAIRAQMSDSGWENLDLYPKELIPEAPPGLDQLSEKDRQAARKAMAAAHAAFKAAQSGQWKGALALYDEALSIYSDLSTARYNQAVVLDHLDRDHEALEALKRLVSDEPRMPLAWQTLGVIAGDLGLMEDAALAIDTALKLGPRSATLLTMQGLLAAKTGNLGLARSALVEAVGVDSTAGLAWSLLGDVRGIAGDRLGALEAYNSAQRLVGQDPAETAQVYLGKGNAFRELGQLDSSNVYLARAIDLDTELRTMARMSRMLTLLEMGNRSGAVAELNAALEEAPRPWFLEEAALAMLHRLEVLDSAPN